MFKESENSLTVDFGVSTKDMQKAMDKFMAGINSTCEPNKKASEYKIKAVEKISIAPKDVIVVTVDGNEDFDSIKNVYDTYQKIFPNNKILVQRYPLVQDIKIIHPTETTDEGGYPF